MKMSVNLILIEGIVLVVSVLILYAIFFAKGKKEEVKNASKKSMKFFLRNSLRLSAIFIIIAILDEFLSPRAISSFLLKFKGFKGIIAGTLTGSVMIGPPATSYPIAQYLLNHKGSYSLVTSFLYTWVAVGIVAVPLEFKFLGKRFALLRNLFTFFSAILIALIMEILL